MSNIPFGPPAAPLRSNPLEVLPDPGVSLGSFLDPSPNEIPNGGGRYLQDVLLDVPGVVRQRGPINILGGTNPSFPNLPSNFRTIGITSVSDPNGTDSFRILLLGARQSDGAVLAYIFGRGAFPSTPAYHSRTFFESMDPLPETGDLIGDPTIYFDDRRTVALSVGSQLTNFQISGLTIVQSTNDPFFDAKPALDGGVLIGMGVNFGADGNDAQHRAMLHWRGAGKAAYSTGTISVTQSSRTVTGAGTTFTGNVEPGMFLLDNVGRTLGIVKSVDSATQITLERNVLRTTGAGLAYSLVSVRRPFVNSGMVVSAGNITVASAATTVNGGGTKFIDQGVGNGDLVFKANDYTYIGTVSSVTSNQQLVLTAGAAIALTNEDYVITRAAQWATGQEPIFSAYWNGIQLVANADNRRADFSERGRIFVLGPDNMETVDTTTTGTFYDLPATKPNQDIRGIFPTESAALVFVGDAVYGVFGNDPLALTPRIVHNDGLLSPMTIQPWQGGAIWAGFRSVYWFDGATVHDLLEGRASHAHQQALAGLDYGKFRAWSMLHNGHYKVFISKVNTGPFNHAQGRASSTSSGATTYQPSSIIYSINLTTGALTFDTNVNVRGFTAPPGKLVDTRDAYFVVESSVTLGPVICSAESLFQETGTAGYTTDQIITNPAQADFAPHFYVEGRLNDFGDAERLKSIKQLNMQYSLYGGLDASKLGIDVVTGFGEDTHAISPKVRTSTSVASPTVWKNTRARFSRSSTHVALRFYTMGDGAPAAARIGTWSVGVKFQRPGRV